MVTDHEAHPSAGKRAGRLLIADDHALIREGLRTILESAEDLEVVGEAENGQVALEMCRSLGPDLVLMDVSMPEMDGLETTKRIKEAHPGVRILMVTTHSDPDHLLEAVRSGAAGYVLKEAPAVRLLGAVRRVLSGENALDQELAMRLIARLSEESGRGRGRPSGPTGGEPGTPEGGPEALAGVLSVRETEALRLIALGKTNRQIARELMVSLSTVKTYVQRISKKLGVSSRTQAAVKAAELGVLPGPE